MANERNFKKTLSFESSSDEETHFLVYEFRLAALFCSWQVQQFYTENSGLSSMQNHPPV